MDAAICAAAEKGDVELSTAVAVAVSQSPTAASASWISRITGPLPTTVPVPTSVRPWKTVGSTGVVSPASIRVLEKSST